MMNLFILQGFFFVLIFLKKDSSVNEGLNFQEWEVESAQFHFDKLSFKCFAKRIKSCFLVTPYFEILLLIPNTTQPTVSQIKYWKSHVEF